MGAYDSTGKLRRVVEASRAKQSLENNDTVSDDPAKSTDSMDGKKELGVKDKIPPETARDLIPFPLNRKFVSQAVLSDELREEIWKRIMKEGKSVRKVSAELGVEMSRVGAVVRLKEVEKEWLRIVSSLITAFFFLHLYDDPLKNRLVFKTTTWLQTLRMRASLKDL
jgi:hypothetical protein